MDSLTHSTGALQLVLVAPLSFCTSFNSGAAMVIRSALILVTLVFAAPCSDAADIPASIPSVHQRFADADVNETPDFQKHVVPLLGRLGCNGRACHGSFQGRGGLRLSLFGYDFRMDHEALISKSGSSGPRVNRKNAVESLVLQKPTMQMDHEGGTRFKPGSWQYHLLRNWIQAGATGTDSPDQLNELIVEPAEVVFLPRVDAVPLRVTAVWANGQREDVTALCRFRTNDDSIVTVDTDGVLSSAGSGDTHVIVFYDNGVASVPVMKPIGAATKDSAIVQRSEDTLPNTPMTEIDRLVGIKLQKMGIPVSPVCRDEDFLRRVSLDLTGTLPDPSEIRAFLQDTSADKRTRKVDELLQRPAYAAWWTNKLCDFTGCNPAQQAELGQETSVQWYMWIMRRVQENLPYDELVKGIVLAQGRSEGQSWSDYAQQTSDYFREESPVDFALRTTMPHYWTRRSMQKPEEAAQAFAHNFLGIRLQCAQCHKHPFAPWTQQDFQEFSRFFESVRYGVPGDSLPQYRELAQKVGLNVRDDSGSAVSTEVLRQAQRGRTIPWRELFVAERETPVSVQLLRSQTVTLERSLDPREPIMKWMNEPQNSWFTRAFVNRVWAAYFHQGLIDPADDLNPANPPSNPALLSWLEQQFVQSGYDMKWLHRTIVTSQTYQRSAEPLPGNAMDRRNFSHMIPRRMPAEILYDSLKQSVASHEQLDEVRTDLSRRAIGHLSMRLAGTYAMQVFGKPDRVVNCDCERNNNPSLLQSIFLQNDPLVEQRLEESGWLQDLAALERTQQTPAPEQLIEEAWLRTVSRMPTPAETQRAKQHLDSAGSLTEGLRDVMWALVNTKEYILIH
jgi:hypothetical protein